MLVKDRLLFLRRCSIIVAWGASVACGVHALWIFQGIITHASGLSIGLPTASLAYMCIVLGLACRSWRSCDAALLSHAARCSNDAAPAMTSRQVMVMLGGLCGAMTKVAAPEDVRLGVRALASADEVWAEIGAKVAPLPPEAPAKEPPHLVLLRSVDSSTNDDPSKAR